MNLPISNIPQSKTLTIPTIPQSKSSIKPNVSIITKLKPPTITQSQLTSHITNPQTDLFLTNPQQWFEGLQNFIFTNIANRAIAENTNVALEERIKIVNQQSMEIWSVAFTHISFDRNVGGNNEVLEHLGDKVLGLTFDQLLTSKYPDITEAEISTLTNEYMSKEFQAGLAIKLGLVQWIRILIDRHMHVREDLLEALFGALFTVGENITRGSGYLLCFNLLLSIFDEIEIDFKYAKGNPKTQVKNIFDKMKWYDTKLEGKFDVLGKPEQVEGGYRLTLRFTRQAIEDLKIFGVDVTNIVLADEMAQFKTTVEKDAYVSALDKLIELGITSVWAEKVSEELGRKVENPLEPYWVHARERARKEGYDDLEIPKPRKGGKKFVQLVGLKKLLDMSIRRDVLVTVDGNEDAKLLDLNTEALQRYTNRGKDKYM